MAGFVVGGMGRWLLVIGMVLALGCWGSGASARAALGGTVVVPRVGGGVLAAYDRLHAAGLRVSIPRGLSFDSLAPPAVALMVPAAGRRVRRGSLVTLYLSRSGGRSSLPVKPLPSYVIPKFVGGRVSTAYDWATSGKLAFRAYLAPLKGGGARALFANYRVTRQGPTGPRLAPGRWTGTAGRKRAGFRVTPLTVWGAPSRPGAATGPASAIGLTTATLSGAVNSEGIATKYYFRYGPTRSYGAHTQTQHAGWGDSDVAATGALGGLRPAATYHYRLVATSTAGTTYGADATFTTTGYYQNPVYAAAAMPDPFVLDNGGGHSDYWAFGTGHLFPVLHSADLVHWSPQGTAMTARPAWVVSSGDWHPWSPSVVASGRPCPGTTSTGCYVMFYGGLSAQLNVNCVGVATSPAPSGPYTDQGPLELANSAGSTSTSAPTPGHVPLGCGDTAGAGNIDPSPFIDSSGQAYLYLSTDSSCSSGSCALAPSISVIPLASDLVHAAGARIALFSGGAGTWEASGVQAPTVERPSMELHNGTYYLFYAGGSWQGAYGSGYATATSPTGPFTKSPTNPILAQSSAVLSPGPGGTLVTGPHGGLWMVYAGRDSSYSAPRTLRLDPFNWTAPTIGGSPDVPTISGPSTTPQPTQP